MRSFRPFTWLLIGFLLALASCTAFAEETIPATVTQDYIEGQRRYQVKNASCVITSYTNVAQTAANSFWACVDPMPLGYCTVSKGGASVTISGTNYSYVGTWSRSGCSGGYTDASNLSYNSGSIGSFSGCVAPYVASGTGCAAPVYSCPSGYTISADQQTCSRPDPCVAGTVLNSGYYDVGTQPTGTPSTTGCVGGCCYVFEGTTPEKRRLVNGIYRYYAIGSYVGDGFSCTDPKTVNNSLTQPPPDTCASTFTLTNINGVPTCVSNTTGSPSNPNEPPPPVAGPTKEKTQVQNPDGSTTTTETVSNPDGSKTVTIIITRPDGSESTTVSTEAGTSSPTGPDSDFCKSNPQSPLCQKTSVEGGAGCDVAPTCTGDPAVCASLLQQWEARCELKKQNDFVAEAGDPGTFESKTPAIDQKKQQLADVMSSIKSEATSLLTFAQSGAGTLGCDAGIPVLGSTFKLCFANYDSELSPVPTAIIFISLLLALFVMFS